MRIRPFLTGIAAGAVAATLAWGFAFPHLERIPWAIIVRVIDGDTVMARPCPVCDVQPVRLLGIDAPSRGTPEGQAATRWLENLLEPLPAAVRIERYGRDRYGRAIARLIVIRGGDLSAAMVRAGMARTVPEWGGTRYLYWEKTP